MTHLLLLGHGERFRPIDGWLPAGLEGQAGSDERDAFGDGGGGT